MEDDDNISYLELSIHRGNHSFQMGIYRKPTQTDTAIHSHPNTHWNINLQHKGST
jgi:hypothetical protein